MLAVRNLVKEQAWKLCHLIRLIIRTGVLQCFPIQAVRINAKPANNIKYFTTVGFRDNPNYGICGPMLVLEHSKMPILSSQHLGLGAKPLLP